MEITAQMQMQFVQLSLTSLVSTATAPSPQGRQQIMLRVTDVGSLRMCDSKEERTAAHRLLNWGPTSLHSESSSEIT